MGGYSSLILNEPARDYRHANSRPVLDQSPPMMIVNTKPYSNRLHSSYRTPECATTYLERRTRRCPCWTRVEHSHVAKPAPAYNRAFCMISADRLSVRGTCSIISDRRNSLPFVNETSAGPCVFHIRKGSTGMKRDGDSHACRS